jgi:phospholipase C
MLIISPWTSGGWVCSQVFDHTSVLQFLEARFEIPEPNISAWRRAVCGNLTSAFDFSGSSRPGVIRFEVPRPVASLHRPYQVPPTESMPAQEPGTRKARALPYEVFAHCRLRDEETETIRGKVWIDFANTGRAGAAFYVYNGKKPDHNPRRYTVSAGDMLSDYWETADAQGAYELTVHGPNGYLCQFRGNTDEAASQGNSHPEVKVRYDVLEGNILLSLTNLGSAPCGMKVTNAYDQNAPHIYSVASSASVEDHWLLTASSGWYDLSVTSVEAPEYLRRFAGHIETGRPSISDPAGLEGR